MDFKEEIIREIADLIDCGQLCYVHTKDRSIEYHPQKIDLIYGEHNPWQDILNKVRSGKENYIKIEQMSSFQSFQVMEDFTASLVSFDRSFMNVVKYFNLFFVYLNFRYH